MTSLFSRKSNLKTFLFYTPPSFVKVSFFSPAPLWSSDLSKGSTQSYDADSTSALLYYYQVIDIIMLITNKLIAIDDLQNYCLVGA